MSERRAAGGTVYGPQCGDGLPKGEAVDHPAHYAGGGIEVIDVIEAWGLNFLAGNAVKYIGRYMRKGSPLEDLKKARWYLDRLISQLEAAVKVEVEFKTEPDLSIRHKCAGKAGTACKAHVEVNRTTLNWALVTCPACMQTK